MKTIKGNSSIRNKYGLLIHQISNLKYTEEQMELLNKSFVGILKLFKEKRYTGICVYISLYFTNLRTCDNLEEYLEESNFIKNFFKIQKPNKSINSDFYFNENFSNNVYWWSNDKEGNQQRELFLERLIELTSKNK